jgi:hypothetical protein
MSTQTISLPVVTGGIGAAVSTSHLKSKKTLLLTGVTGSVTVQASTDGVSYCPLATFAADGDKVEVKACAYMRVDASLGAATSAQVMAERGLVRSVVVPSPPANGPGASVDVSDLGCLTTVGVSGISAGGSIGIEVSPDDVNWSVAFKTYTADGCDTESISARFMRAVGYGQAGANVGASAEESEVPAASFFIVWAPEDPLGDRGNIYTGQGVAGFRAVDQACKDALEGGSNRVKLSFNAKYSSILDPFDRPACEIPDSSGEPTGKWHDFEGDFYWTCGFAGNLGTPVIFADDAQINVPETLIRIEGAGMDITADSATTIPLDDVDRSGITAGGQSGARIRIYNTNPAAAPFMKAKVATGFRDYMLIHWAAWLGGFGLPRDACAAPLIDINGAWCEFEQAGGYIQDNALMDSSPTSGFSTIRFTTLRPWGAGSRGESAFTFPALGAIGAFDDSTPIMQTVNYQAVQYQIGPRGYFLPPAPLVTADGYQMRHGESIYYDTTAGDITTYAPLGSPAAGTVIVINNTQGLNNVILEPFGGTGTGNVRNVGGVDDSIVATLVAGVWTAGLTHTVPSGKCHTLMCDAGNGGGQGVANWQLISIT